MKNKKGMLLVVAYIAILLLLIMLAALAIRAISEKVITEKTRDTIKAFYIAESGIERAMYDLKRDFIFSPGTPSWRDGRIYTSLSDPTEYIDLTQGGSITVPQDYPNSYPIPYGTASTYCPISVSTSIGGGSFTVSMSNMPGDDNTVWISSTGTYRNISKTIRAKVIIKDICPWNNVIFGGTGSVGEIISGNVNIHGSVIILGDSLTSSDLALDMSGGSKIGNNYSGLDASLQNRIPPCPTVYFNGESVESLGSELRVKRGRVGLSGTATVGDPDNPGDAYKETVGGTYVTDGFTGDQGTNNVYSDNGYSNRYDLGDSLSFPSLSDPFGGYASYVDYAKSKALVVSDPAVFENITPYSSFSYSDANGSISMDGNGNMTVSGWVVIDGSNFTTMKEKALNTITYTGKGILLVTGNININTNLVTPDVANSFPQNIIGFMTPNDINFATSQLDAMGAFYAENQITSEKQTTVIGGFVSNFFDMGTDVPNIYHLPLLANYLPDDFVGNDPVWFMQIVAWQEL